MILYFILFSFQTSKFFLQNTEEYYNIFYTCKELNNTTDCVTMSIDTKESVYGYLTNFFILRSFSQNLTCIVISIIITRYEFCMKRLLQLAVLLKICYILISFLYFMINGNLIYLPILLSPFYISDNLFDSNIIALVISNTTNKKKNLFVCEFLNSIGIIFGIQLAKNMSKIFYNSYKESYITIFSIYLFIFFMILCIKNNKTKKVIVNKKSINKDVIFLLIMFLFHYCVASERTYLYFFLQYKFDWNMGQYLNFKTFQTVTLILISLVNIFYNKMSWKTSIVFGCVFNIFCRIVYLFAEKDLYIYFACVFGPLGIFSYFGLKMFLVKNISESMFSNVYLLQLCVHNISNCFSTVLYGTFFKYSKDIFLVLTIMIDTVFISYLAFFLIDRVYEYKFVKKNKDTSLCENSLKEDEL